MTARIFIATAHIQAHSQAGETTVHAVAPHTHGFRWRTLLVGLMHGVAGTAALLVLAASSARTRATGLFMSCCFDDRYGRAVLRDRGADCDFRALRLCKIRLLQGAVGLIAFAIGLNTIVSTTFT